MDAVPYKLLNGSECAFLAAKAREAAAAWTAAWSGAAHDPGDVSVRPAADFSGRGDEVTDWLAYDTGDGGLYLPGREPARRLAARLLSGDSAGTAPAGETLAGAAVDRALEDLAARIAVQAVTSSGRVPSPQLWQRHSGATWIALGGGEGGGLDVIVDAQVVARLIAGLARPPRRAVPLSNPQLGLGRVPVDIDVWLGTAELELSVFQTLAAGDVIQLDSRIDQALKITVAGRAVAPRAFLGYSGERRAVRLTGLAGTRH